MATLHPGLQARIFRTGIEAGAVLVDVWEVAVAEDAGIGMGFLQAAEQAQQGAFLAGCAGVGGSALLVETAFVADADGVGVVVAGMGADHELRPSWLDLSVTTDHVMVAYAEVETPIAMPCIDLSCRARLVRPHRRTVNHYQCNMPHDCIRNVDTKAVITVRMKLPSFSALGILKNFIFAKYFNLYLQGKPCWIF